MKKKIEANIKLILTIERKKNKNKQGKKTKYREQKQYELHNSYLKKTQNNTFFLIMKIHPLQKNWLYFLQLRMKWCLPIVVLVFLSLQHKKKRKEH